MDKYGLDAHCNSILEQYRSNLNLFKRVDSLVKDFIPRLLSEKGVIINAFETRIKGEESLAGKLSKKGAKYNDIFDLTDIVGARIVSVYTDDVDKVSGIIGKVFKVDWANSVDKRKMHELNSFGYNSLHYICSIPESLYKDPDCPQINRIRFEVQMRTALQHVWSTLNHEIGYKSGVDVPSIYLRNLNRLAGMLELADEQFSTIRTEINKYRYEVQSLVRGGRFEDVPLNEDSFNSYLELKPFNLLLRRMAAINQAEIYDVPLSRYLAVFKQFGFTTLADVQSFIKADSDDAYHLAVLQFANTDIDILTSSVAVRNLCVVHLLKNGSGVEEIKQFLDIVGGESDANYKSASRLIEISSDIPFFRK